MESGRSSTTPTRSLPDGLNLQGIAEYKLPLVASLREIDLPSIALA